MPRYAIGDVQGCHDELRELLRALRFSSDRDELWFVGDLVNRGPQSVEVLRLVRSLGANAVTVLGNHDLHLLAVAFGSGGRQLKRGDTLDGVLGARDRGPLLEWLLSRPLAHHDVARGDLLVHAGLVPQWRAVDAARLAGEVGAALAADVVVGHTEPIAGVERGCGVLAVVGASQRADAVQVCHELGTVGGASEDLAVLVIDVGGGLCGEAYDCLSSPSDCGSDFPRIDIVLANDRMSCADDQASFHVCVSVDRPMPIEMVRALLAGVALTRDYTPNWRFYPL